MGCSDADEVLNKTFLIKQLIRFYLQIRNAVKKDVSASLNKTTLFGYSTHQNSQTCNDLWEELKKQLRSFIFTNELGLKSIKKEAKCKLIEKQKINLLVKALKCMFLCQKRSRVEVFIQTPYNYTFSFFPLKTATFPYV